MCLTGIEHLRLKNNNQAIPDVDFFKKYPTYNERVLNGLLTTLQLFGCTGDPTFNEELYDPSAIVTTVRTTDIDAFECFCVLCLKHIVGTATWRREFRRDTVPNMFTISDEAFAFLVLDNNREYWKQCYIEGEHNIPVRETNSTSGRAHKRIMIDTKYTKRGSVGGKQGWNQEGIETYNALLRAVMENRGRSASEDMERSIKLRWNTDRMNQLQNEGRVLNDINPLPQNINEPDADIVDSW
jgi:hypothetical protein